MRALLAATVLVIACGGGAGQPSPTIARPAAPTVARTTALTAPPAACATAAQPGGATKATIELVKGGAIVIQLRPDKAPGTVANFAKNSRECKYDGLTFHRVLADFVAQGGDPLGTGGGGGDQPTELSDVPFTKGAVGVARAGDIKVSNDSQFFICVGSCLHLNGQYTNFGQVISGQQIADAIRLGDKIRTIRIE